MGPLKSNIRVAGGQDAKTGLRMVKFRNGTTNPASWLEKEGEKAKLYQGSLAERGEGRGPQASLTIQAGIKGIWSG